MSHTRRSLMDGVQDLLILPPNHITWKYRGGIEYRGATTVQQPIRVVDRYLDSSGLPL